MSDTQRQVLEVTARGPDGKTPGVKERAIDEGKRFLIITGYLWVFFALLSLHRTVLLQETGINYAEQGFAIVNALIFAKVMLVADDLKLGTRLVRNAPLIHSIIYGSLVFAVVLVCFHVAEGAIIAWVRGSPIADSLAKIGAGSIKGILSLGGIALVAMIPFFSFREIGRAVGESELWQLVFSRQRKNFRLVAQE